MKGINPYELIIEGLVFSLLLFPGFFPSPYISLAFVVVILAVLCVVSKRYPNTAMRREILQFRRIGWIFLVMLFCLLLLQSMFVLEIDRVAMQRSVVLMAQIYLSVGFFSVLSSGLINLKCVVKAACLFCILFSVYYFYYVSQTCITLDRFCDGKRDGQVELYYALDWEKVSKNQGP